MGLSVLFCLFVLILSVCLICAIKEKTAQKDQEKLASEIGSDLQGDLQSHDKDETIANLLNRLE